MHGPMDEALVAQANVKTLDGVRHCTRIQVADHVEVVGGQSVFLSHEGKRLRLGLA